ncbi:hypothetical protein [Vibrio phage vB_VhaM_VH-8]|nr:hypothetical protein [Vibrio phage vB_VhaM_VH-8]
MTNKVEVKCKQCQEPFMARVADRKRGWGKFCSKSCKAKKQTNSKGNHYKSYRKAYENYSDYVDDDEHFGNVVITQDYTWNEH